MKREFLRGLGIDEDHIPKILDEHHDSLKEYKDSANKVSDLENQLKTANEELANRDKQIEDLKASTTDNEDLQKQLDEYKANNEQYESKLKQVQLDSAIKLSVAKDANDPSDVLAFIDRDGLEVNEDGSVKGLDEKLTGLKESKPYLFSAPKKTGRTPDEGDGTPPSITKEDFNAMDYEAKADLYEKQPEVFNQLSN